MALKRSGSNSMKCLLICFQCIIFVKWGVADGVQLLPARLTLACGHRRISGRRGNTSVSAGCKNRVKPKSGIELPSNRLQVVRSTFRQPDTTSTTFALSFLPE